MVYFIAAGTPPVAIKIGMAAQTGENTLRDTIKRRLSAIQTSNHEAIMLLGVIYFESGDYPTRDAETRERELHLEFAHLQRFKEGTKGAEWFTATPELLARIQELATRPAELGLPETYSEVADGD